MINKHKSNKIKENSNTVRHLNNGTDHRHSKSRCDQSSPARRTIKNSLVGIMWRGRNGFEIYGLAFEHKTISSCSRALWQFDVVDIKGNQIFFHVDLTCFIVARIKIKIYCVNCKRRSDHKEWLPTVHCIVQCTKYNAHSRNNVHVLHTIS